MNDKDFKSSIESFEDNINNFLLFNDSNNKTSIATDDDYLIYHVIREETSILYI